MDSHKLKIKVGQHEFEAEGDAETVKAQFNIFKELVSGSVIEPPPPQPPSQDEPAKPPAIQAETTTGEDVDGQLSKIMKVDKRTVSLTVRAGNIDEAVLLLVYGQKAIRGNDAASGSEIMNGLTVSGQRVPRVDRVLAKADAAGDLIALGVHRGKRYRLTNPGLAKARSLAGALISTVP